MWTFLLIFPLLLGGSVEAEIKAKDEAHCNKVRTLLVAQLDAHRSNATVTNCKLKE
jgi:hypothetical protein